MMNISIICVGKLKEKFYADGVAEYQKRLSPYCKLDMVELAEEKLPRDPSPALIHAALATEAAAIRAKLPPNSYVVALCVEGRMRSSEELAVKLRGNTWGDGSAKRLVFLIGGSHGLDEDLKREANDRLSMSPMTFPHHLARVMLLEQIYRGFKINEGSAYHK